MDDVDIRYTGYNACNGSNIIISTASSTYEDVELWTIASRTVLNNIDLIRLIWQLTYKFKTVFNISSHF